MKIVTILGARPQFIKAATISRAIRNYNKNKRKKSKIQEYLLHTGQHYDSTMSSSFFRELELPSPDVNLNIRAANQSAQTGKMMIGIEQVLIRESPDWVIVFGDTNSTIAGALAASKLNIPLAHIEAGLRSYNREMPEEINRVVTDHLSNALLCPTRQSIENLAAEGILSINAMRSKPELNRINAKQNSYLVGDVMYDSVLHYTRINRNNSSLNKYGLKKSSYLLATIHRAGNTNNEENILNIMGAFEDLTKHGKIILFPAHPRTKKVLVKMNIRLNKHIRLIEPVPYLDMIKLIKCAEVVITDSGGVQKESYFLKVPCVTIRDETEWPETIRSGWNELSGLKRKNIVRSVLNSIGKTGSDSLEFGDGGAAEKIINIIRE